MASEALRVLTATLYDQRGAHRLIAQCDARNRGAVALFARLGFRDEARHVDADFFKEVWTARDPCAQLAQED
ncbi:N-acetyltransferase [Mycetocola lacteus]|uniref:N-acetyltransferase n=1 Tax=Mycetocola lacteus TaxID=76637 RepID=A0A3L7ASH2_9MICO|nr:GNAT family protein [Mycetocola lacteus]RLP82352.1 N-acetyltransferase [Mycetocola lacteus]